VHGEELTDVVVIVNYEYATEGLRHKTSSAWARNSNGTGAPSDSTVMDSFGQLVTD
jgi:hypothetical protein